MKSSIRGLYTDFLSSLDQLNRLYPGYYRSELLLLSDDVVRWFNGELGQDSSALSYLSKFYRTPREAMQDLMEKIHAAVKSHVAKEGSGRTLSGLGSY